MNNWEIRLDSGTLKIFGPGPMRIFVRDFNPQLTSMTEVGGLIEAIYPLGQGEETPGTEAYSLRVVINPQADVNEQSALQSFLHDLGATVVRPGSWLCVGDEVEWYVEPEFARQLVAVLHGQSVPG